MKPTEADVGAAAEMNDTGLLSGDKTPSFDKLVACVKSGKGFAEMVGHVDSELETMVAIIIANHMQPERQTADGMAKALKEINRLEQSATVEAIVESALAGYKNGDKVT